MQMIGNYCTVIHDKESSNSMHDRFTSSYLKQVIKIFRLLMATCQLHVTINSEDIRSLKHARL